MKKFFDSVDQEILLKILSFRIKDSTTLNLLKEIIFSFNSTGGGKIGMPIGNLTSQIFANIYLNELDRFVKHELQAGSYLRYGDDFIIVENDLEKLRLFRTQVTNFLNNKLKLVVNPKSDKILKPSHGLKFLGIKFWLSGRNLNKRSFMRAQTRLNSSNISSYSGLIKSHCNEKKQKYFNWFLLEKLTDNKAS
ncbi:MAG: RNA-directed DNA polymerase [Candidatus Peregrinibacteria bacterium]|nr:RNA-directed DNA polymerase [Candidatus Peregrinibacteria bacterium]